jgi:hypothetical protein
MTAYAECGGIHAETLSKIQHDQALQEGFGAEGEKYEPGETGFFERDAEGGVGRRTRCRMFLKAKGMSSQEPDAAVTGDNEAEYSQQLSEVERRAVRSLVAGRPPQAKVILTILNQASSLAEISCEANTPDDAPRAACKEGCNWCCHQRVRISAAEAVSGGAG